MQQFLIPSSGGASQIINIPVSLLSQGNQQPISFITANGQIFQLPNFSQLVVHQNGENGASNTTSNANSSTATAITAASTTSSSAASSSATSSSSTSNSGANQQQQALVINSQGQIISLPVLQPQTGQQQTNSSATNVANFNTASNSNQQQQQQQQQQTVNLSQINFASLTSNGVQLQSGNVVNTVNRTTTVSSI